NQQDGITWCEHWIEIEDHLDVRRQAKVQRLASSEYANDVPDELFDRAVGAVEAEAVQNAVQYPAASLRTASQGPDPVAAQKAHKPSECEGLQELATCCDEGGKWTRSQRIRTAAPKRVSTRRVVRSAYGKRTRSLRIRTAARVPVEVPLLDTAPPPLFQRISHKAHHLRELGLSNTAIAQRLGVTHHTVAKAITWHRSVT
ncbi:MAG: hypothetical protein ACYS1E_15990, partial [Planctomycetota bacterium]